jgi:prolyl-tRNA synthetase
MLRLPLHHYHLKLFLPVRFSSSSTTSPNIRITPRVISFSRWYADVISAADLVDAETPVKGCTILRPRGFALWSGIQRDLDARIIRTGAQGVYFPLLVPVSFLSREATHVAGFASEVAVVTHSRLAVGSDGELHPDPKSALSEPLVVRPTSEALVWDAFSRWVRSARDLPIIINQWANVVRWERRTRPFLRTTEFLWQEGHTAHADEAGASAFADTVMSLYAAHARDTLALAPILGEKSSSERFAGAKRTRTVEAILTNGWALQSATVHELGTAFSSAFNVSFARPGATPGEARLLPYGTSWGASTRLIGAITMTHSDDIGLVLPPAIAPEQIVIVALAGGSGGKGGKGGVVGVTVNNKGANEAADAAQRLTAALREGGGGGGGESGCEMLRVVADCDVTSPGGSRFFEWERRGVPLRLELGPREIAAGVVSVVDRIGALRGPRGKELGLPEADARGRITLSSGNVHELTISLRKALRVVHDELLARAERLRDDTIFRGASYHDLKAATLSTISDSGGGGGDGGGSGGDGDNGGGGTRVRAYLVPWTDDAGAETRVRLETHYTLRCFPDDAQSELRKDHVCFMTGRPATHMALFARAF